MGIVIHLFRPMRELNYLSEEEQIRAVLLALVLSNVYRDVGQEYYNIMSGIRKVFNKFCEKKCSLEMRDIIFSILYGMEFLLPIDFNAEISKLYSVVLDAEVLDKLESAIRVLESSYLPWQDVIPNAIKTTLNGIDFEFDVMPPCILRLAVDIRIPILINKLSGFGGLDFWSDGEYEIAHEMYDTGVMLFRYRTLYEITIVPKIFSYGRIFINNCLRYTSSCKLRLRIRVYRYHNVDWITPIRCQKSGNKIVISDIPIEKIVEMLRYRFHVDDYIVSSIEDKLKKILSEGLEFASALRSPGPIYQNWRYLYFGLLLKLFHPELYKEFCQSMQVAANMIEDILLKV